MASIHTYDGWWDLLIRTNLAGATLTDSRIFGVSAWGVTLSEGTKQQGLVITPPNEPTITVNDLEVAQFVYLLLHNEKSAASSTPSRYPSGVGP